MLFPLIFIVSLLLNVVIIFIEDIILSVLCDIDNITKGTDIKYHPFPKDPKVQRIWILKCHRKDNFNTSIARICSKHFSETDYVRDLRAELMSIPLRRVLREDAIPHMNHPVVTTACNVGIPCRSDDNTGVSVYQAFLKIMKSVTE